MNNCKHCGKEVKQTEGRRERQFCDNKNKCRNAYHNATKTKESTKVLKATYDAVVLENKALKARIKELEAGNPVMDRGAEKWGNGSDKELINQSVAISQKAVLNLPHKKTIKVKDFTKPANANTNTHPDRMEGESMMDYKIRTSS